MAVPNYDFVWQQGEDGVISLVYKREGNPVNLTGYQVRMDVRSPQNNILFTFNSDDITEVPVVDQPGNADNEAALGGAAGTITISVPRAASLNDGPLVSSVGQALNYDVFLRDTNNKQRKILKGTIVIEPSYTKWT